MRKEGVGIQGPYSTCYGSPIESWCEECKKCFPKEYQEAKNLQNTREFASCLMAVVSNKKYI